jgi:hypothetical protein
VSDPAYLRLASPAPCSGIGLRGIYRCASRIVNTKFLKFLYFAFFQSLHIEFGLIISYPPINFVGRIMKRR